jgi:hypothetical protein
MGRPLFIGAGDMHMPWHLRKAVAEIVKKTWERKPRYFVQIGDLKDCLGHSRWGHIPEMTPEQEFKRAHELAVEFWRALREASPRTEFFYVVGNHEERLAKKIMNMAPDLNHMIDYDKLWTFKGINTVRERELILEGRLFTHGGNCPSTPGAHARFYLMPTIIGHTHMGHCIGIRLHEKSVYELNLGFLGDRNAKCFEYQKSKKFSKYTVGYGLEDDDGPRFCPLPG